MTDRCTGACCKAFPLSVDLNAPASVVMHRLKHGIGLRDYLHPHWVEIGIWGMTVELPVVFRKTNFEEAEFIHDMLIPIEGPWPANSPAQAYFTCRHFDGANCTVYEQRPQLCRRHGVTNWCDHQATKECTLPWPTQPAKISDETIAALEAAIEKLIEAKDLLRHERTSEQR